MIGLYFPVLLWYDQWNMSRGNVLCLGWSFIFYYFLIGVLLLYNAVLVSAVQQSESVHVYIYPFPLEPPSHPTRSSQSTEPSSVCYSAASHELSSLHLGVHICRCYFKVNMQLARFPFPSLADWQCSWWICEPASWRVMVGKMSSWPAIPEA